VCLSSRLSGCRAPCARRVARLLSELSRDIRSACRPSAHRTSSWHPLAALPVCSPCRCVTSTGRAGGDFPVSARHPVSALALDLLRRLSGRTHMPAARRPGAVLGLPTIPSQCAIRSPRRPSPRRDGGVLAPPTFRLSRVIRMLRAPLAQLSSLMRSLPAESHYANDGIFDGQLDMYCASEISL
jgi:hypothetical protein